VERIGSFRSSDARLDQIWQVGADTTALNMLDAYADPWRERGQWWGDVMASYRVNAVAFGDTALLKRGLVQMADAWSPDGRPPAFAPAHNDRTLLLDFGMLWVEGLRDYWRVTGDTALVRELFPTARRLATFLQSYEDGAGLLTFAPEARWHESALIDWGAGPARRGTATALNAQYAATLGILAELALVLNDPAEAQAYQAKQGRVTAALNDQLSNPNGGYITGLAPGLALPPKPQAQAWPLAYGVVPPAQRAATADALERQLTPFLLDHGPVVEIYGMHWVLEGLATTGRVATAQRLIRDQYGRLLERGATTWWEGFRSDEAYDASLSHGWGGGPTPFLSHWVLGAQLTAPNAWQVAPHPGELVWAEGSLPTPRGVLRVSWSRPACGAFEVNVAAPPTTSGALLLPLPARAAQVWLNDRLVWDSGPIADAPATLTPAGLRLDGLSGTIQARYRAACTNSYISFLAR
jgi:alpha-L-rhamnosidase